MAETIFYSWQSDSPNSTNRGFIEKCIKQAIEQINSGDLAIDFEIDRDTLEQSGSPDIVQSIFTKISNCRIFVGDVSIINPESLERRLTPNPNVLIELGWAAGVKSWDNIICVFNQASGKIENLPFDLRVRRIISYTLQDSDSGRSQVKSELTGKLKAAIVSVINDLPRLASKLKDILTKINPEIRTKILQGQRNFSINVIQRNDNLLQEIQENSQFEQLATIASNGNYVSSNLNSNGGINDVTSGPLNGYNVNVTDIFAQYIA